MVAFAAVLAAPRTGAAREVAVPLRVDHDSLRRLLLARVYTEPGDTAAVWHDDAGCNTLTLSDPTVAASEGRLRIVSAAAARVGTAIGDRCLFAVDWTGSVEVLLEPEVVPGVAAVRFRVVDSTVAGRELGKRTLTGTLWGWVKRYVQPRFETFTLDLGTPLAALRAFLPAVLPSDDAARTDAILASLAIGAPRVDDDGLALTLRFDVPEVAGASAPAAPAGASEPPLSDAELARVEAALERWDAFLTFVVKQAAGESADRDARLALARVLLDARYDVVATLTAATPGGPDPVRALFLATWKRLRPVLRTLGSGLPADAALRYLGFVAAGDALRALDEIGPATGLEISADGLRRLARILAPAATGDPLAYDVAVDPELRRLSGFGPPLAPPVDNPAVDLSRWEGVAWAAEPTADLAARLNRWVPSAGEIAPYLELVRQLLHATTDLVSSDADLDRRWHDLYRPLVLATAWQETCWRQFVKVGTTIKPLRSPIGSVGLMQVNQRVWRGFYDLQGLARDIGYNARAGAEILVRYLVDDVLAGDASPRPSDLDAIALATYAVYNGGPSRVRRHRKARLGAVGKRFAEKFRTMRAGDELAVRACYPAD